MSIENTNNMSVDSESDDLDDDDGTFYFESDHLALRDNPDYCNALRLICKLQAQRIRITEQMEQLILAKNRYLENPELVVKKLQNNEPIVDEKYLTVEKIPEIDANSVLAKYDIKMKEEFDPETKQPTVRGRVLDETKPKKFNQLWTDEEQRRLDELLIEYPAEEVEMRRFAKIAKALGNRTTQQVSSRVQKYFQKLHEAGLPIPGRAPKNRRSGLATRFKTNFRPTTFFPAFNVPVNMPEDEQLFSDFDSTMQSPTFGRESENGIKPDTDTIEGLNKQDAHERKLFMLKKIREEKHQSDGYNPDPLAPKCENCNASEVTKTRWYCQTCYCYIKLCLDCLVEQLLLDQFDHISHNVVINNES